MRKLVCALGFLGLLFLLVPAEPAQAQLKECEKCEAVKAQRGISGAPVEDYVCLYFVLPQRDKVTLFLYNKNGTVTELTTVPHGWMSPDGTSGRICPSRAHFQNALTMELCTERFGNAIYNEADTQAVAAKAKHSTALTGCLKGTVLCEADGYEVVRK